MSISSPTAPKVGVGVLIVKDGLLLLGKRKGSHGSGSWSPPGGHLEFGETIKECAKREVLEETGLEIKNVRLGPYTNDIFEDEQKHYLTVFVTANPAGGTPQTLEPQKCEGWGWFEWTNLPDSLFRPLVNLRSQGFQL